MSEKLLAIDPSLTASGWALFSLPSGVVLEVGIIRSLPSEVPLEERLNGLQQDISSTIKELNLSVGDVLVCEGPAQLVLNPQSALKLERVRGIFEAVARMFNMEVPGRINPRTVQSELLGMRGRQSTRAIVKDSARVVAERLYQRELIIYSKNFKMGKVPQDIIDALLIGTLAVSRFRLAKAQKSRLNDFFEGAKVRSRISRTREGRGLRWDDSVLEKINSKN